MKDKIKIPKKYKEALYKRFSPDNLTYGGDSFLYSHGSCTLCNDFLLDDYSCPECPLEKAKERPSHLKGCVIFLKEHGVMKFVELKVNSIRVHYSAYQEYKNRIREAEKDIEWVE